MKRPWNFRRLRMLALVALLVNSLAVVGVSSVAPAHSAKSTPLSTLASQPTNRGNNQRTGWYADQNHLAPSLLASSHFGQLFNTSVNGQIFAQPLVDAGVLIVATMTDWVYGLDPATGAVKWSRQIATPFYQVDAWTQGGLPCTDVGPYVGVLSTPTVDPRTGVVYLVNMAQDTTGTPSYWMQAINPLTGASEPGFPVEISGTAANDPALSFDANLELQRPGLLLLNGTVYAAFSSHCDQNPFYGFVVGVTTQGSLATIWTDVSGTHPGGGIWQSGVGLVQYGNDLLIASGNGFQSPKGTIAGTSPPASLGESVIDLSVNPDGSLTPVDFFSPYNSAFLDKYDLDVGTGAPVLLPPSFGTSSDPHVVLQESKSGYLYLLNADHLGGVGNGPNGGDAALSVAGPYGGMWASPAVLSTPTGGYLYVPTATGGTGSLGNANQGNFDVYQVNATGAAPVLSQVATAGSAALLSTPFDFGASSPVVTSNGSDLNSAVVWVIRSDDGLGDSATLQAYRALPQGHWLSLINEWPIGRANKFTSPGVWNNTIYAATGDGHVLGFGATSTAPLVGQGLSFAPTNQGTTSPSATVTLRATKTVTVSSVSVLNDYAGAPALFQVLGVSPSLATPRRLRAGDALRVKVDFAPGTSLGAVLGTLVVADSAGVLELPLSGLARAPAPLLYASTRAIDFGGVTAGTTSTQQVEVTNQGSQPLVFGAATLPASGFTLLNPPSPGAVLAPGASLQLKVSYSSSASAGAVSSSFTITTAGASPQQWTVALSAQGAAPAQLSVATSSGTTGSTGLDLGATSVGQSTSGWFSVTNTGGSTATLLQSHEPTDQNFEFDTTVNPGFQLVPGQTLRVNVTFQPSTSGVHDTTWTFGTDVPGQPTIGFSMSGSASGSGFALPSIGPSSGWQANGSAQLGPDSVTLTPLSKFVAGSAFWPVALNSSSMTIAYTTESYGGSGANGSALVLADASKAQPTALGNDGTGIGLDTTTGVAVVIADYPAAGSPPVVDPKTGGHGWVAITDGWNASANAFDWLAGTNLPASLGGVQDHPLHVVVSVQHGVVTVTINGLTELTTAAPVAPTVLAGFASSTGYLDNVHLISDARVTIGAAPLVQQVTVTTSAHFATTTVGSVHFAPVTLHNPTSNPVTVTSITTTNADFIVAGPPTPLTIAPGATASVLMAFQPATSGAIHARALFTLPGGVELSAALSARASGASTPTVPLSRWRVNGNATRQGSTATLTTDDLFSAGSLWSPSLTHGSTVTMSMNVAVTPGTGADGVAVLFADPRVPTNFVGSSGWGLGFAPSRQRIDAVVLSEILEPGAPRANFVGLADGGANGRLHWRALATLPEPLATLRVPVFISASSTSFDVWINGVRVLHGPGLSSSALTNGVRVGISGSTGALSDTHAVSDVRLTNS